MPRVIRIPNLVEEFKNYKIVNKAERRMFGIPHPDEDGPLFHNCIYCYNLYAPGLRRFGINKPPIPIIAELMCDYHAEKRRRKIQKLRQSGGSYKKIEHNTKPNANVKGFRAMRVQVFQRDDHTCLYCGLSVYNFENIILNVDHVIPRSAGGPDNFLNLVTSCLVCHKTKLDHRIPFWTEQDIFKTISRRNELYFPPSPSV